MFVFISTSLVHNHFCPRLVLFRIHVVSVLCLPPPSLSLSLFLVSLCCLVILHVIMCFILSRVRCVLVSLWVSYSLIKIYYRFYLLKYRFYLTVLFALILSFCIFIEGPTHYKHCFLVGSSIFR